MPAASHSIYEVFDHQKLDLFLHLLGGLDASESVLVLVHTRDVLHELTSELARAEVSVESVHGNKKAELRDRALKAFADGSLRVLITTDAVGRNLDLTGVQHVIRYDFPENSESYGYYAELAAGQVISLMLPKQATQLAKLESAHGAAIPLLMAEGFPYASQPDHSKSPRKKGGKAKGIRSKPLQNKKPKLKNKRGR
ncbi:C-terminal helicase domain-containing protein [Verrucomicrobiaceae bacterium R5-34]|uniref:C-terminal helicase domain-containing protein n=1 Tax=Oceaniferula flava TaxID=2800421 RepID=A0AAE2VCS0_9BACT|nr:C-terminal helicase domain-containing protein [Oceaniferula flavus]MBK1831247.1 C-terminal helicase domain-containing protein [Verrucomicrobiaceae bacterium R5-34]MBK1855416.1 C-terminal helicase domain-containing protein [Oceaniferula flavus]MBM1136722.1 C-terminal helicase domain-containing protein [Oceaniferula flavus]